jgi:hypothetical protein
LFQQSKRLPNSKIESKKTPKRTISLVDQINAVGHQTKPIGVPTLSKETPNPFKLDLSSLNQSLQEKNYNPNLNIPDDNFAHTETPEIADESEGVKLTFNDKNVQQWKKLTPIKRLYKRNKSVGAFRNERKD